MGTLALPPTGPIHVDANIVLYTVNIHPTYYSLVQNVWLTGARMPGRVRGSELLILECFVGPLRFNDPVLSLATENALFASDLTLMPIDNAILREAARIRAVVGSVRVPDAIHAATALIDGTVAFLTNDPGFRRVAGLPVILLDDVSAAP